MNESLSRLDSAIDADPSAMALILMPFLGGSRKEWSEVVDALPPETRCIGLDLPGFGEAAETKGYSVAEMAAYVIERVKSLELRRFVLVGHSMGGKVAMVVASLAKERPELSGLSGLVLVASSPPCPEPMTENKRAEMKENLGKPGVNYKKHAEEFIRENVSGELSLPVFKRAVGDILRMNCQAWTAWLDSGSKEDWSARVGELDVDSLVVAGEEDAALGPQAQSRLVMPHLPKAQMSVVSGAAHLIPMERPMQLAQLITDFIRRTAPTMKTGPMDKLDPQYKALIQSNRVSGQTRAALLERLNAVEEPVSKNGLTHEAVRTLQKIAEYIVPLTGYSIDFGAKINERLAASEGKGWRYAELPPDLTAYTAAIKSIDRFCLKTFDRSFVALEPKEQIRTLTLIQRGEMTTAQSASADSLDAAQMQRWFEDLRGDVAALYMSHPETLAQVGYSGIADGADSTALSGFVELGLGKSEPWEPKARGMSK